MSSIREEVCVCGHEDYWHYSDHIVGDQRGDCEFIDDMFKRCQCIRYRKGEESEA